MNYFKKTILSSVAALALLLVQPATSYALTSGTLSLSGTTTQSSGTFTVTIYASSDDTVNYADAEFTVSASVPVSVSAPQILSPFSPTGAPCSAAYCAIGGATGSGVGGSNPLATFSLTLASPGSATVSFASSSSLKHATPGTTTVTTITPSTTGSTFTYVAPAQPSQPAQGGSSSNSSSTNGSTRSSTSATAANASSQNSGNTLGESNGKAAAKSNQHVATTTTNTHKKSWADTAVWTSSSIVALVAIAGGLYWMQRRRTPVTVPVTYKAGKKTPNVTAKSGKSKPAAKSSKATTKRKA